MYLHQKSMNLLEHQRDSSGRDVNLAAFRVTALGICSDDHITMINVMILLATRQTDNSSSVIQIPTTPPNIFLSLKIRFTVNQTRKIHRNFLSNQVK